MSFESNRRSSLKKIAAGLGAAALGKTGLSLAQSEPLKIACIYPLSGPISPFGTPMLAGAQIAAEQFNRSGGVLGRKIEIVARDDKASPAESALVGRELLGSGIKFVVGGLLTAPGMAIINLLNENNALYLMTGAQIMGLTHENFHPNVFRALPNSRMWLFASAKAMAQTYPNVTKWIGLAPDNQFGSDNYKTVGNALKKFYKEIHKKDIEVLDPILTPFPATDFKVQISRIMSSPAEGLYIGVVGADYPTFMGQGKQLGLYNKMKVFLDAGGGVSSALALGNNLPKDNLWSAAYWQPDPKSGNAVSKQLIKDYAEKTGKKSTDPSIFSGHVAMTALLTAIRNAKTFEPATVRAALERVEFEAASGPFRFRREDHQAVINVNVINLVQKSGDPGWDVAKIVPIKGEDVIEPAGPGKPYTVGT
jgi:branched-chain amino acid transport system substrate-binding protein